VLVLFAAACARCSEELEGIELCTAWNRKLDEHNYRNGYAQPTSAEGAALRIIDFVRTNSTVIDIGGHLGRFAEAVQILGGKPQNILIFEPVHLLHLCQIQRLGHALNSDGGNLYEFFNFALGSEDNKVDTILMSPDKWTASALPAGWNTLYGVDPNLDGPDSDLPNWREKMGSEPILIRTLSRVLTGLAPSRYHDVSVIKIDAEGYEGEVLRGTLPFLRYVAHDPDRILPVMIIETAWGIDRHPDGEENLKTYHELVDLGYCPTPLLREETVDVLWVPIDVDPSCSKHKILEGGRL
jgi:FkbM family methyltransferase